MAGRFLFVLLLAALTVNAHPKNRLARSAEELGECYQLADIALVVDSSSSIRFDDFVKGKTFIAEFAEHFRIGPEDVRFAAVTFSEGVNSAQAIPFDRYGDIDTLKAALLGINHTAGPYTATGEGIKYMREHLMNSSRPGVEKIGVVLTDGNSQEWEETGKQAEKARAEGIRMIAIGVGNVNPGELKRIASGTADIFKADKYDDLDHIAIKLLKHACEVLTTPVHYTPPPTTSTTTTPKPIQLQQACGITSPMDIYFMYDSRIGADRIFDIGAFIHEVVRFNNFRGMRYGTITICGDDTQFDLGSWDYFEIAHYFDTAHSTKASELVTIMNDQAYITSRGHRLGSKKVGVLFIDGKIDDHSAARRAVKKAQENGVDLYVVNLGRATRRSLNLVQGRYLIDGKRFSVWDLGNLFMQRLCQDVPNILEWQ